MDTIGLALVLRNIDKPIFCKEDEIILIEEIIQANLLEELSHEIFLSKWDEIDEKKRLFFEKF